MADESVLAALEMALWNADLLRKAGTPDIQLAAALCANLKRHTTTGAGSPGEESYQPHRRHQHRSRFHPRADGDFVQ